MVHKDFLDMNVSWLSEDLELIEYHPDIFTSSIFTAARVITLAIAIIVHRAFYKLMKRLPGRAVNTIIYPNMVRCIHSFFFNFSAFSLMSQKFEVGDLFFCSKLMSMNKHLNKN